MRTVHFIADLPAGGRRIVQEADGYLATIKAGRKPSSKMVKPTGAMPGKAGARARSGRSAQDCAGRAGRGRGALQAERFSDSSAAFA